MSTLKDLLLLEHAGWRSLCDSTGSTFYGETMIPDGVMVLTDGTVLDRDGVVASLDQAPAWASYTISEERLVPLQEDAAALVYRGTAQREAHPGLDARMTSTYVRRQDRWRLACYQQTPLPR